MNAEAWIVLLAKNLWLAASLAIAAVSAVRLRHIRRAYRRRVARGGNGGGRAVYVGIAGELLASIAGAGTAAAGAVVALLQPESINLRPWPLPAALLAGLVAFAAHVARVLRDERRLGRTAAPKAGEHAP